MKKEWIYKWSIVRGARQGDIYAKYEASFDGDIYKVVLLKDGEEIPATDIFMSGELDYCREVAEEFVQGEESHD